VFGPPFSPERSLLLFICNAAQITFMFAIWYYLYRVPDPLIKSILTFATIGYAAEMKPVAMVQIATDFVLLAIYLSQLIGGPKNGMTRRSGQFRASMPPTIMRGRRAQALGLIRPNRATWHKGRTHSTRSSVCVEITFPSTISVPARSGHKFTAKINKLVISVDPPKLTPEDMKKLSDMYRAAQDAN
jgi:hypothetical protein